MPESPRNRELLRAAARFIVAISFIAVGITHFAGPEPFVQIMPQFLPWHLALVYLSGAAEILGGLGILLPPTRRAAGWGLLALLVAVFPANINMAINEIYLGDMPREPWILWARLPMQIAFAGAVYWVALLPKAEHD